MKPSASTLSHSRSFRAIRYGAALALSLGVAWPVWAAAPFTVNGNGTVSDSSTSLVWDQCPYGLSGSACATGTAFYGDWASALTIATQANAASYKGFSDWRVPNVAELESITKIDSFTLGVPAIDTTAFPGTSLDWFWTSTTYTPSPRQVWIVDFDGGDSYTGGKTRTFAGYVRLVRSGQPLASFDSLASADLSISTTDGVTSATPGANVTYTIVANNAGPDAVSGVTVADSFPAACTAVSWTCASSGGGTCAASGSGNINDASVVLPVGASVTYTAVCSISASATGTLSNTATVSSSTTDPTPGNNAATDTDTVNAPPVAAPIPTLTEWGAILLSGLMLLLGWRQVRRRG